jgi:hypothetical protein
VRTLCADALARVDAALFAFVRNGHEADLVVGVVDRSGTLFFFDCTGRLIGRLKVSAALRSV